MKLGSVAVFGVLLCVAVVTAGCPQPVNVSYSLTNTVDLLAPSFYTGEAWDGSNVAGRQALLGQSSHDGTKIAFWAINTYTSDFAFFIVNVDNPTSYRRITPDYYGWMPTSSVCWTPDDSALMVSGFRIVIPPKGLLSGLVPWPVHGVVPSDVSTTSGLSGNWQIAQRHDGEGTQIIALPILPNGHPDPLRQPVYATDFAVGSLRPDYVALSADGSQVAFADFHGSTDGVSADTGDVYVLKNLKAILAAPLRPGTNISSLAPMRANDPNVIPIRVDESANFAETPAFSRNGRLVLYSEDFNNAFMDDYFFETLPLADFDLLVSNADGSGQDFRIELPGIQTMPSSIPGSNRIVYTSTVDWSLRLLVSTLETVK